MHTYMCVYVYNHTQGFSGGSLGKEPVCQRRRHVQSVSGRSPGGGHGYPLQHSCLENPMDRGAWWAAVHGVAESWIRLSDFQIPRLSDII